MTYEFASVVKFSMLDCAESFDKQSILLEFELRVLFNGEDDINLRFATSGRIVVVFLGLGCGTGTATILRRKEKEKAITNESS